MKKKKGYVWMAIFLALVILPALVGFWVVSIGATVILIVFFLIVWFYLAPRNKWFTFIKEGTAKNILKGGKFKKTIIQWEGKKLYTGKKTEKKDETGRTEEIDKWDVVDGEAPEHLFGGLRYYGVYPVYGVKLNKLSWTGVEENGKIVHHEKETHDYVLLKDDIYWAKVDNAEDCNLFPLKIELLITLRIVNPYKAIFKVQNWLEAVITRTKAAVREVSTEKSYEDWISQKNMASLVFERLSTKETEKTGEKKKKSTIQEFKEDYGVEFKKIDIKQIDPLQEYRERTLAPYLAKMRKKATIIDAEAEKKRMNLVFSTISKFGDLGKLIRSLEAIEKSKLAASLSIQAIPGLQEAFRGIFGKSVEDTTREEDRLLREAVQKLLQQQETKTKTKAKK